MSIIQHTLSQCTKLKLKPPFIYEINKVNQNIYVVKKITYI